MIKNKDVNECNNITPVCHGLAICSNLEPGFSCQCQNGYKGTGLAGFAGCIDVNECTEDLPRVAAEELVFVFGRLSFISVITDRKIPITEIHGKKAAQYD